MVETAKANDLDPQKYLNVGIIYYNDGGQIKEIFRNLRVPMAEKIELINECQRSGLTDADWCWEHDIPPGAFYNWVSRCRKAAAGRIVEPGYGQGTGLYSCKVRSHRVLQREIWGPNCKEGLGDTEKPVIIKFEAPAGLIGKSFATSSTVSWTVYQKFSNTLPLYRQGKD